MQGAKDTLPHGNNRLDDATLLARLGALVGRDRTTTAKLLWHLGEVEARGLYRDEGYSSLFEYCVKKLHMSEGEAWLRVRVARLSRRFPVVLSKVARGELHLSALRALLPVLTQEHHQALLEAATHKTRREVEQMLADMAPKPDATSAMRKLPSARPCAKRNPTSEPSPAAAPSLWSTVPSEGEPGGSDEMRSSSSPPSPNAQAPAPTTGARAERRGETTPLGAQGGAQRYRVQFTASQQLHDQIRQAQDLLRHQIPNGDLAAVMEKALTLLVEQLKKRHFGQTHRPRKAKARPKIGRKAKAHEASAKAAGQQTPRKTPRASRQARPSAFTSTRPVDEAPKPNHRHIPAEVRRKVVGRDGARCTFVSDSGRRCEATGWLEFHHIDPFACGGPPTVDNVCLMCRSHNALMAERDFGRDFILGMRHGKRVSQRTDPEPSPG